MVATRKPKDKQPDGQDSAGRAPTMVTESRFIMFEGLPFSPRLEKGLSEIRAIMKREGLIFCLLRSDDKIYFIPGGNEI
jgi:hypothetical protein